MIRSMLGGRLSQSSPISTYLSETLDLLKGLGVTDCERNNRAPLIPKQPDAVLTRTCNTQGVRDKEWSRAFLQKKLSREMDYRSKCDILSALERRTDGRADLDRARFVALENKDSSVVLTQLPSCSDYRLTDQEVAMVLRMRLGLQVSPTTLQAGTCRSCEKKFTDNLTHALCCRWGLRIPRHNLIRDLIISRVRSSGLPLLVDRERAVGSSTLSHLVADITVHADGATQCLDVTIPHPGAQSYRRRASSLGAAASMAAIRKRSKWRSTMATLDRDAPGQWEFIPFCVETYGYIHEEALGWLSSIATRLGEEGERWLQATRAALGFALARANSTLLAKAAAKLTRAAAHQG
jgi:hypothetical protein